MAGGSLGHGGGEEVHRMKDMARSFIFKGKKLIIGLSAKSLGLFGFVTRLVFGSFWSLCNNWLPLRLCFGGLALVVGSALEMEEKRKLSSTLSCLAPSSASSANLQANRPRGQCAVKTANEALKHHKELNLF